MSQLRWTRRHVLAAGAAALGAPYFISARTLGFENAAPPSDTVRVGMIGCGGRARSVINEGRDVKGIRIVAACDCVHQRAEDFARDFSNGEPWGVYDDFRKMIEEQHLDGVMIETTTHARAWIAVIAMQMGMDVYIEKPMALTIAEGREMVDAARKLGRVTQIGTQQRSIPLNNWASDLVKNGAIGAVKTVLAPNFVGPFRWTKTSSRDVQTPVESWWDMWTSQAELRPHDPELQFGWAKWSDYDGGGLGFGVTGWGAHSYDQINRALGTDDTGPTSIMLEEAVANRETGRFQSANTVGTYGAGLTGEQDTGSDYHSMAKLVGPRAKVRMSFDNGTELRLHLDGDRGPGLGAIFIGENGKIEINRDKVASNPAELVAGSGNPGPLKRPETAPHIENWIECIKNRQPCTADIEIGQRASTLCYLVNIVREVGLVGQKLHWDPVAEQFTDSEEANALLSRPRRAGFELPVV
jgi:predicted dehydrogenase